MAGPFLDDNYPQCQQDQDTVTSITITNGVVNVTCYSGRQFVSVASHVCDEGYQPNVTSSVRVCRDNGLWSGTTIVCGEWLTLLALTLYPEFYKAVWCTYGSVSSFTGIHVDHICTLCTVGYLQPVYVE